MSMSEALQNVKEDITICEAQLKYYVLWMDEAYYLDQRNAQLGIIAQAKAEIDAMDQKYAEAPATHQSLLRKHKHLDNQRKLLKNKVLVERYEKLFKEVNQADVEPSHTES